MAMTTEVKTRDQEMTTGTITTRKFRTQAYGKAEEKGDKRN